MYLHRVSITAKNCYQLSLCSPVYSSTDGSAGGVDEEPCAAVAGGADEDPSAAAAVRADDEPSAADPSSPGKAADDDDIVRFANRGENVLKTDDLTEGKIKTERVCYPAKCVLTTSLLSFSNCCVVFIRMINRCMLGDDCRNRSPYVEQIRLKEKESNSYLNFCILLS